MNEFEHIPVLFKETIDSLNIRPEGIYCDGTAGGGNHSFAIGSKLSEKGRLLCTDRDMDAVNECNRKLSPLSCGVEIFHTTYTSIPEILTEKGIKADGLLLDLGVSSHQLDEAERGFSYMQDAPLDMRMNREDSLTAADVVNGYGEEELAKIFFEYGEERYSRQIASKICKIRANERIETTLQLSDIIKSAMPAKALREAQHPAKRVFQALRIEVNSELTQVETLLENIFPVMNSGGRISIITFHSLEDRIVKLAFAKAEKPCTCPPSFPVCVCGKVSKGKVITRKPIVPSQEELEMNPRSRSAKLRVFEIV